MKRNYRSDSWLEWITTWVFILVFVPLGLMVSGFFFKILFNCFMAGWNLI